MARAKKQTAKSRAQATKKKAATKKVATPRAAKAKPAPKKAKAAAKPTVKAKAKTKAKSPAKKPAPKKPTPPREAAQGRRAAVEQPIEAALPTIVIDQTSDAIPNAIFAESSAELVGPSHVDRARPHDAVSPVVEILDDPHPIGALRRFLDSLKGEATPQQAQIALGSAQLMLLPIAREHRGGTEVKELIDLMLQHWSDFGDRRRGFHAQEFLRNAFAAVGVDRERIAQLEALVPTNATAELLFNVACAHAVARDKVAMLRAVEAALEAGTSRRRSSGAIPTSPSTNAIPI